METTNQNREPKFKIGDKVKVKDDAVYGEKYNLISLLENATPKGKVFTIKKVDPCDDNPDYLLDNGSFVGEDALELAEPQASDLLTSVIQDLKDREIKGIENYGTSMDRTDLTQKEWIQHAYEEALDLALYLKKIMTQ